MTTQDRYVYIQKDPTVLQLGSIRADKTTPFDKLRCFELLFRSEPDESRSFIGLNKDSQLLYALIIAML